MNKTKSGEVPGEESVPGPEIEDANDREDQQEEGASYESPKPDSELR